jgi:hypothetical protein
VTRRKKATEFIPAPQGSMSIVDIIGNDSPRVRLIFNSTVRMSEAERERINRAWLFRIAAVVEELSVGEEWLVDVGRHGNGSDLRIELASYDAAEADRAMRILRQVVGLPVKEEKR